MSAVIDEALTKAKDAVFFLQEEKREALKVLQNDSISVADRVKLWFELPNEIQSKSPWVMHVHGADGEEATWYDDYYCDKYADLDFKETIKMDHEDDEAEKPLGSLFNFDEETETLTLKEDNEHAMRFFTEVIRNNIYGFTNDW
jgi:hypothetical protein